MNHLTMAWERVNAAVGLTEVLDAAHAAFTTALSVIEDEQDPRNPLFVTFVMAGATAATGRLALTAAPSLPDSSRSARSVAITKSEPSCGMADEDLADLSRLCQATARRLYDAALTARDAADRAACSKASHHARELCSWFGGLRSG